MKTALKFLALLVCCAWLSSCENEQDNNAISPRLSHKVKFERDLSDAYRIAREHATSLTNTTRSGDSRQIAHNDVHYLTTEATRATDGFDTLYYVVNYEDDKGFAIIPKNKLLPDVVVLTEQGNYNGEETDNELFNMFMSGAKAYATNSTRKPDSIILNPQVPRPVYTDTITICTTYNIRPKIATLWWQEAPFNTFCIDNGSICPAGCAAIAIGQIMGYYRYPTQINLTYPGRDVNQQALNWNVINGIPFHYHGDICDDHLPMARLIREIGEQVNMTYTTEESYTNDNKVRQALSHFGYARSGIKDYNTTDIVTSLQADRLVYFSALDAIAGDGHAMLIDGFIEISKHTRIWEGPALWPADQPFPWVLITDNTTIERYIHCNFGWGGTANGWYIDGLIDTDVCIELDENSSSPRDEYYEYTINPKIITDIKPE